MSMIKEMFGDNNDEFYDNSKKETEKVLIAKGDYKSDSKLILDGYNIFRKKYVYGKTAFRLFLVLLAIISSVLMILTDMETEKTDGLPYLFIAVAVVIGGYFLYVPANNKRMLKAGLKEMEGEEYTAEIYEDRIKISSLTFAKNNQENKQTVENNEDNTDNIENNDETDKQNVEKGENNTDSEEVNGEQEEIPATIIHLHEGIVDLLDEKRMFIIVVNKSYIFIIPKSAFTTDEIQTVKNKLSDTMGIRYKAV